MPRMKPLIPLESQSAQAYRVSYNQSRHLSWDTFFPEIESVPLTYFISCFVALVPEETITALLLLHYWGFTGIPQTLLPALPQDPDLEQHEITQSIPCILNPRTQDQAFWPKPLFSYYIYFPATFWTSPSPAHPLCHHTELVESKSWGKYIHIPVEAVALCTKPQDSSMHIGKGRNRDVSIKKLPQRRNGIGW